MMYTETVMVIALIIAFVSAGWAVFMIRHVKKQILEMTDVLDDIKNGNGNRRILSDTHELIAPLAYKINDIVFSYENRLSACRQTEEADRQLMTSLSHDVRTPLTTLLGYLDAVHKGIARGKERDDYIEIARRVKGIKRGSFYPLNSNAGPWCAGMGRSTIRRTSGGSSRPIYCARVIFYIIGKSVPKTGKGVNCNGSYIM